MPGYVIHLAIGKVYSNKNKISNLERFERGIIAPDLEKDKAKSHYGSYSSIPDLDRYLKERGTTNEFDEAYFLHYLFYNRFLKEWNEHIYDDYDKLNDRIIKKYHIVLPKELLGVVKFKEGELELLDEERIYSFIDAVGKIDINDIAFQNRISEIQFEER